MIDIRIIREHPDEIQNIVRAKGVDVDIQKVLQADNERKGLQQEADNLRAERNRLSSDKPDEDRIRQGKDLKQALATVEEKLRKAERAYQTLMEQIPNIPTDDTPMGSSEADNTVIREVGEKAEFSFSPKPHWELGEASGTINTKRAAVVAGSRFAYLMGDLALLQFALLRFAFDVLIDRDVLRAIIEDADLDIPDTPFIPVLPPCMIRPDVFRKMARLDPKEDKYYLPEDDLFLAGSAEHTLGPLHMRETLTENDLPIRYAGYSTAFRREAGAHGRDVRGILRLHQFDKIEMESFATAEQGSAEQDFFVAIQEYLMRQINVPYRVVLKCTADMGGPDARAFDIEAWMPGQDRYRETHTADYMSDYQSRRLGTRVRRKGGAVELVHMNDATVFAMGRTIIAIMENHQQEDGSIRVPDSLVPYLSGRTALLNGGA